MSLSSTDHGLLTPSNCVVVCFDDHPDMLAGVENIGGSALRHHALVLLHVTRLFEVPAIVSEIGGQSARSPGLIDPGERDLLLSIQRHERSLMSAWADPAFTAIIEKTGRNNLVIAATWAEVSLVMPALHALADGYGVYAVIDACGAASAEAHAASLRRIEQAGAVSVTTMQVMLELHRDWAPTGRSREVADLLRDLSVRSHYPSGRLLPPAG